MTPERKALAELVRLERECDEADSDSRSASHRTLSSARVREHVRDIRRALSADTREEARPMEETIQCPSCRFVWHHAARPSAEEAQDCAHKWLRGPDCYQCKRCGDTRPHSDPPAEEALPVAQEPWCPWHGGPAWPDCPTCARSAVEATPPARDSVIEECAKVCEGPRFQVEFTGYQQGFNNGMSHCAAAIRALKEKQT